jgi:hypothetical protein
MPWCSAKPMMRPSSRRHGLRTAPSSTAASIGGGTTDAVQTRRRRAWPSALILQRSGQVQFAGSKKHLVRQQASQAVQRSFHDIIQGTVSTSAALRVELPARLNMGTRTPPACPVESVQTLCRLCVPTATARLVPDTSASTHPLPLAQSQKRSKNWATT